MIVIGVTGGVGSGKTQFCKALESLGIRVLYADELAINLMETNLTLKKHLIDEFGQHIYLDDDRLNRRALAEIIFQNPAARDLVESWVHPEVYTETMNQILLAKEQGIEILVKEAALLLTKGRPDYLNHVVLVVADEATRVHRLMDHRNWTKKQIDERMEAQMSQEQMKAYADTVIENSGTLAELHSAATSFIRTLIPS